MEHTSFLKDKIILLTGGTGSFGQTFTRLALKYGPKAIRIFSRGELAQYMMQQEFNDKRLRFFIGDVRDQERLHRAMINADIVVHAAALKQVPTCEYNPIEAIKTNINGSVNVIEVALDREVKNIIAISSDKAANPINLYGATKMVMEKLFVHANVYASNTETKFSCVRYGNVIGSRGSVLPLFLEQKKQGVLTITDEDMTRFWFRIDEGAQFVIDCLSRMKGGEIFVPRLASLKVMNWAEIIAPDAEIKVTGLRPGEKLHEVLITEEEAHRTKNFETYFVIEPELSFWDKDNYKDGTPVPSGFKYTSEK